MHKSSEYRFIVQIRLFNGSSALVALKHFRDQVHKPSVGVRRDVHSQKEGVYVDLLENPVGHLEFATLKKLRSCFVIPIKCSEFFLVLVRSTLSKQRVEVVSSWNHFLFIVNICDQPDKTTLIKGVE